MGLVFSALCFYVDVVAALGGSQRLALSAAFAVVVAATYVLTRILHPETHLGYNLAAETITVPCEARNRLLCYVRVRLLDDRHAVIQPNGCGSVWRDC